MGLKRLFAIDAWLMLVVGFLFWGYSNASWGYGRFGIDDPGPILEHMSEWRAISFAGAFGGALMAFGFSSLAIAIFGDARFQRRAAGFFLAGHFFLSFVVLAKQVALWETPSGYLLLDIVAAPGIGFFYYVLTGLAPRRKADDTEPESDRSGRQLARQQERNRLAQDLHDSVKQQIFSIQTNLAAAQTRWATDSAGAQQAVEYARDAARDAMTEMTALLDRLRRDPVETLGLPEALRRQCEALKHQSGAEVVTHFEELPPPGTLSRETLMAIFRIAQEALANVGRHARAKHVRLNLGIQPGTGLFVLDIADDGQGFDTKAAGGGMGLANIRMRAEEIGAQVMLASRPGEGTTLSVSLPLPDPAAARKTHHEFGLLAVLLPLAPLAVVTILSEVMRPYVWPLVVLGIVVALFHGITLARLQWHSAKS